jgi:catechol 2,3-dioxygenase-like lactoylglutathione lyase family enzyme
MLHHISVGVADVSRAAAFYDAVLATLGYKRVMEVLPYAVAYGAQGPQFWIGLPANQAAPSCGNGVHVAFAARSREAIAEFHRAALGAGGSDEGGAGPRPDYGPDYYGAFVRDPDGNKLEAVLTPEPAAPPAAKVKPRAAPAKAKTRKKKAAGKAQPATRKKAKKAAKKTAKKAAKPARRKKAKRAR